MDIITSMFSKKPAVQAPTVAAPTVAAPTTIKVAAPTSNYSTMTLDKLRHETFGVFAPLVRVLMADALAAGRITRRQYERTQGALDTTHTALETLIAKHRGMSHMDFATDFECNHQKAVALSNLSDLIDASTPVGATVATSMATREGDIAQCCHGLYILGARIASM